MNEVTVTATVNGFENYMKGFRMTKRTLTRIRVAFWLNSIRARIVANRVRLRQWRQRKREALHARFAPVSHGVLDDRGEVFFFDAHGFYVREGRLVFWCRCWIPPGFCRTTGIVEAGKWVSVIRGATPTGEGSSE